MGIVQDDLSTGGTEGIGEMVGKVIGEYIVFAGLLNSKLS